MPERGANLPEGMPTLEGRADLRTARRVKNFLPPPLLFVAPFLPPTLTPPSRPSLFSPAAAVSPPSPSLHPHARPPSYPLSQVPDQPPAPPPLQPPCPPLSRPGHSLPPLPPLSSPPAAAPSQPPFPPPLQPPLPPPSGGGAAALCSNACNWADDEECDDGGPGNEYWHAQQGSLCPLGSDCDDCGPRQ